MNTSLSAKTGHRSPALAHGSPVTVPVSNVSHRSPSSLNAGTIYQPRSSLNPPPATLQDPSFVRNGERFAPCLTAPPPPPSVAITWHVRWAHKVGIGGLSSVPVLTGHQSRYDRRAGRTAALPPQTVPSSAPLAAGRLRCTLCRRQGEGSWQYCTVQPQVRVETRDNGRTYHASDELIRDNI